MDKAYKTRLEKEKRLEAERQAAIERDNEPYDPDSMQGRMPLSCGLIVAMLFVGAIIAVCWLVVKVIKGG